MREVKKITVKTIAATLTALLSAFLVTVPAIAQRPGANKFDFPDRQSDLKVAQDAVVDQAPKADQGYITVNGARIFYTVVGKGEPMVLVHGYPLSGDLFARNRNALAKRYKVITMDLRGYGRSSAPEVPASISIYAKDVLDVMNKLGVPKAIIGGMSMGGPTVFEMYQQAPERFRGMILIDTIADDASPAEAGLWRGVAEQAALRGVDSLVPLLLPEMLSGDTRVSQPQLANFLTKIIEQASLRGAIGGAYALANRPDYTQLLGKINVPVLILVGLADTVYPVPVSRSMNRAIQNSTLVVIPGPAHAAIFEAADRANTAILEWANKIK